jgi:hypothetical protein
METCCIILSPHAKCLPLSTRDTILADHVVRTNHLSVLAYIPCKHFTNPKCFAEAAIPIKIVSAILCPQRVRHQLAKYRRDFGLPLDLPRGIETLQSSQLMRPSQSEFYISYSLHPPCRPHAAHSIVIPLLRGCLVPARGPFHKGLDNASLYAWLLP